MKFYKVFSWWEWFIYIFLVLFSLFLVVFYLRGIKTSMDYKGIQSFKNKNFTEAQKYFNQALIKKPFVPWNYINLALSQDMLNLKDKALKNYDTVSSKLINKSLSADFFSYFNKGELYGRLNQLDKALKNYQKALEFHYKEKIVKKNIELLFKDSKKSKNQKDQKGENNKKKENQQKSPEEQRDQQEQSSPVKESKEGKQDQSKKPEPEENQDRPPRKQEQEKKQQSQLTKHQQKAILEEVEKQENKVRSRFYRGKTIFGDKTQKDW